MPNRTPSPPGSYSSHHGAQVDGHTVGVIPYAAMSAGHSLSRAESFPIYKQLASDNSCGPRCILMVADYFEKERGRKLYAHEWSRVLEITMENDLVWEGGTRREDIPFALADIGLGYRLIRGTTPESSRKALARSLDRDHPVIVSCKIPHKAGSCWHYAVLVSMDDTFLRFADPYPYKGQRADALRVVPWSEFQAEEWSKGETVWGRGRWGVEVFCKPTMRR